MNHYAQWFRRVMYAGIGVNLIFVALLIFVPEVLLTLLQVTVPEPMIWVRFSMVLLLEITIIYVPVAWDPFRYPVISWMTIVVTRGGGVLFSLVAVLLFQQQLGFLTIALTDGVFASLQAFLLYRAFQVRDAS